MMGPIPHDSAPNPLACFGSNLVANCAEYTVLPVPPVINPLWINGRLLERYLDTVEVRSSSLLVPTISFVGIERIPEISPAREQPVSSP